MPTICITVTFSDFLRKIGFPEKTGLFSSSEASFFPDFLRKIRFPEKIWSFAYFELQIDLSVEAFELTIRQFSQAALDTIECIQYILKSKEVRVTGTYVIGDVHGCYSQFMELLERIGKLWYWLIQIVVLFTKN